MKKGGIEFASEQTGRLEIRDWTLDCRKSTLNKSR